MIGKHSATFRAVVNPQGGRSDGLRIRIRRPRRHSDPGPSCASLPGNGENGVHVSAEVGGLGGKHGLLLPSRRDQRRRDQVRKHGEIQHLPERAEGEPAGCVAHHLGLRAAQRERQSGRIERDELRIRIRHLARIREIALRARHFRAKAKCPVAVSATLVTPVGEHDLRLQDRGEELPRHELRREREVRDAGGRSNGRRSRNCRPPTAFRRAARRSKSRAPASRKARPCCSAPSRRNR